jgi:small subunit ribosomal protein S7
MSRRHTAEKRVVSPDPRYHDEEVTKFINILMLDGKRSVAESIFYGALEFLSTKHNLDPLLTFHAAMANVLPPLEVRSRRIGGATCLVPTPVPVARARALTRRWVIGAARKRSERSMMHKLAAEFLDASQKRGGAYKKSEDTRKTAEGNMAYSHLRTA